MCKNPFQIYGHLAVLKLCQIAAYDADLGNAAKKTLVILAGYCGSDECCYPSLSKISKRLGLSRTATLNQVKILEQKGYIERSARFIGKARKTSIITFKCDVARYYSSEPEFFCKKNSDLILAYLVTILRYRGMELLDLACLVTSKGDINKTVQIKQLNKTNTQSKFKKEVSNKKKVAAGAWEQEKEFEKKTGITKETKDRLKNVNEDLKAHLTSMELTSLSIRCNANAKGMVDKDAIEYQISFYQAELDKYLDKDKGI